MSELKEIREEITAIDEQMAVLFERRMHAVKKVAAYKEERNLPVRDRKTEAEKIRRQREQISEDGLRPYYDLFLQAVMDISCAYQEAEIKGMQIPSESTEESVIPGE